MDEMLLRGVNIMKKKYQIAAIIFIILSCVFGCKTLFWGRIWNCVSCVIFLIFTILLLVHSYKENHDSYRKTSKLFSIEIVLGFITLGISPFFNGITSFRPVYAYKHYYKSYYLNHDVFPEKIPTNASDIKFRILGEGISSRAIYTISFKTDEKTLNELRQNAASLVNCQ